MNLLCNRRKTQIRGKSANVERLVRMKAPLFVRTLSKPETEALKASCRSRDAFTLRRCQIILASSKGQKVSQIVRSLHCSKQTVRNIIHAFVKTGLNCLKPKSSRPKTVKAIFQANQLEQLKELLHTTPRHFGKKRSIWTLRLLAEVCVEQRVTEEQVSPETIRQAFQRLRVTWKRAKNWITSPDPQYQLKKSQRERLLRLAQRNQDWILGFADEVWWSRLAQPHLQALERGGMLKAWAKITR